MVTVKDTGGKELEGYFCPFAGEMCYEGDVVTKAGSPKGKCRFWSTGQAQRCRLLPALSGLAELMEISDAVRSLPSGRRS